MYRVTVALSLACALGACNQPKPPNTPINVPAIDYNADEVLRLAGVSDGAPFYERTDYDPAITTPDACLQHPLGQKPAASDRILACFQRWAEQSPRIQLARYAMSHEGRELVRAVITTPQNLAKLAQIKSDLGKLADPRGLSTTDADRIVQNTPAVGWFGYSIHGNEMSGSDASLAFTYHLLAAGDAVAPLLSDVVVVIDPNMNPDGRHRTLGALSTMQSNVPDDNHASRHGWSWPNGRGNHYLFDLNRDWIVGVHPETRGRWAEILSFHPQLFVDAHEMGSLDTYLFSPKNKPYNPGFPAAQMKWYRVFAGDIAAAFDKKGWAYYTREWSDGWFPGYSSTWGPINGAIGFLYEQSSTGGRNVRRPSGVRVTYRDSIRGHAVASLVNLATLAKHRQPVLRDYLAARRAVTERVGRAFVLVPGRNPDREHALIALLMRQRIEVHRANKPFRARDVKSALGQTKAEFPAGSYVIFDAQGQGNLVDALLDFDPRQDKGSLVRERREIERNGRSRIYDVTAWNLGHAFALDVYWTAVPSADLTAVTEIPTSRIGVRGPAGNPSTSAKKTAYGWLVDGSYDGSAVFAAQAMELGLNTHVADEPFEVDGRSYRRGTVLVRVSENPANAFQLVSQAGAQAGVPVEETSTGRAPGDGVDLGGHAFRRLERPRIALLANGPLASNSFGHVWHHLDKQLQVPVTLLDIQRLGSYDLRRYNVIIAPDTYASIRGLLEANAARLQTWIKQGGTLIAMARSAADVAHADLGLSTVRLRRDVLDHLPVYRAAANRSVASRAVVLDQGRLWGDDKDNVVTAVSGRAAGAEKSVVAATNGKNASTDGPKPSGDAAKQMAAQRDAWERRFSPRGAMLRGLVDDETWITAGAVPEMAVLYRGDWVFLAPESARTAIRFSDADTLRLSGLVWPEARTRIAHSAYLTVERSGRGQVILFAFEPVYRGFTRGTARLLSNAVIYGPGMGASQPTMWHGGR